MCGKSGWYQHHAPWKCSLGWMAFRLVNRFFVLRVARYKKDNFVNTVSSEAQNPNKSFCRGGPPSAHGPFEMERFWQTVMKNPSTHLPSSPLVCIPDVIGERRFKLFLGNVSMQKFGTLLVGWACWVRVVGRALSCVVSCTFSVVKRQQWKYVWNWAHIDNAVSKIRLFDAIWLFWRYRTACVGCYNGMATLPWCYFNVVWCYSQIWGYFDVILVLLDAMLALFWCHFDVIGRLIISSHSFDAIAMLFQHGFDVILTRCWPEFDMRLIPLTLCLCCFYCAIASKQLDDILILCQGYFDAISILIRYYVDAILFGFDVRL